MGMITKEDKLAALKSTQLHDGESTQLHDGDTGSSSAQVAILTKRINEITEHMKQNKHDFMARRGLIQMVGRRKKLLRALERDDYDQYKKVIETLGLRK